MRHRLPACVLCALLVLTGCRQRETPAVEGEGDQVHPAEQIVNFPLAAEDYPWPRIEDDYEPAARFEPPRGFSRTELADRSWGQWLRHLPLKPPGTPVLSRQGETIVPGDSAMLGRVVDMDVRVNQECADVILRLRAEYLRWAGREDEIVLNLTGPGKISWPEWRKGMRPRLEGNQLKFYQSAKADASRASFEQYLDSVFAWCGTLSLAQDGKSVAFEQMQVGDFFVHGGSPGHAVLVADLARDEAGNLKALLLQGYMPAQSVHILAPGTGDVWFDLDPDKPVDAPPWGEFQWAELKRFKERAG